MISVGAVLEHEAIPGVQQSKPSGLRGRITGRMAKKHDFNLDSLLKLVRENIVAVYIIACTAFFLVGGKTGEVSQKDHCINRDCQHIPYKVQ